MKPATQTVEKTSKHYMEHTLYSIACIIVGVLIFHLINVPVSEIPEGGMGIIVGYGFLGGLLFHVGLVWFILTIIKVWRHHG